MVNYFSFNPFIGYPSNELKHLMHEYGTKVIYPSNTSIISSGYNVDSFYFIDKGKVRYVSTSLEGEEQVVLILEEGSFFGAVPIIANIGVTHVSVIAETTTVLFIINKDQFNTLLNSSDIFRNEITKGLAIFSNKLMEQLSSFSFSSCKKRLYELFYCSIDKNHPTSEGWYKLKQQYTQQDLANIIGATRVTVTRIASELCDEGLIRIVNRKVEVKLHK